MNMKKKLLQLKKHQQKHLQKHQQYRQAETDYYQGETDSVFESSQEIPQEISQLKETIVSSETDKEQETDQESDIRSEKKKRRHVIKKKPLIVSIIISLIVALGISFSWYLFTKDNHADTKDIQIMTPYFLYLLNPDDQNKLQFSIGNIYPGQTKQIVICVSNKRPDNEEDKNIVEIARTSYFEYDLEFVYTENIPVDYTIYELSKVDIEDISAAPEGAILVENVKNAYWSKIIGSDAAPIAMTTTENTTGEDVSPERWASENVFNNSDPQIVNKGHYDLYKADSKGNNLGLRYEEENYEYDYYLVEISWKKEDDGKEVNFSEYTKETDMLYVVVNSKQPKPNPQNGS